MKKHVLLGIILFFTISVSFVNAEQVDISELPQRIADALNISLFAGQIMLTVLFMSFFVFPTMLLTNRRSVQETAVLFTGFGSLAVCVAVGWCPYWILLILVLVVAVLLSSKMKGWIGG